MSTVTVFVDRKHKNESVREVFVPQLRELLNGVVGRDNVTVDISSSPDCSPAVILSMRDFGGFDDKMVAEIGKTVRKLTRQHFGIENNQISVTLSANLIL